MKFAFQPEDIWKSQFQKYSKKPAFFRKINVNGQDLDVKKEKLGVFTGAWKTSGADISKRGTRTPLVFVVDFSPEGQMKIEFQSKVYNKVSTFILNK